MKNEAITIDNNLKLLEDIHSKITFADSKANFLVVICLALFTAQITLIGSLTSVFEKLISQGFIGGTLLTLTITLSLINLALISVSIYKAIKAINPQLNTQGKKHSLLYFGAIANMALSDYKEFSKKSSNKDLLDDILNQIHENSQIVESKFRLIGSAVKFVISALIFVGTFSILHTILQIFYFKTCL